MTIRSTRFARLPARTAFAATALLAAACSGDRSPTAPPQATIVTINGSTVNVTIAATRAAREQGLMGVTNLGPNSGMLFVFADDRQRSFWMKDTPTALSIVFLDASSKIVFMADMTPNTTTQYGGFNTAPMRYALEVNAGWFAGHGITTGMTASFTLPAGLVVEPDP